MEDTAFKKDETAYLIFACKKCQEYSYVKTTQKTKKCLRCGRTHQVRDVINDGEVVYGITEAVNAVKRKQNELATPEFRSGSDFVVATNSFARPKSSVNALRNSDQEIDYKQKFTEMLMELSKLYKRFPEYMLKIMAENYGIPTLELEVLIRNAKKSGMLIKNGNDDTYYKQK
ncbi:MAG TPA: DUF1922 domain-containing protein [Candidatus Bathyarchaeia archaeon]|nr:DUF1922 domain-containing protein [Candidatus Bathyarchaeia archaeon]